MRKFLMFLIIILVILAGCVCYLGFTDNDMGISIPLMNTADDNGDASEEAATVDFKDVTTEDWFYDYVNFVVGNGIMTGVAEDEFAPYSSMTRAMIAQMLYSMAGAPETQSVGYMDVAEDAWYINAVDWVSLNNIMSSDDAYFRPEDQITREELAVALMNYAEFNDIDCSTDADISTFNDANTVNADAVDAMKWAIGTGVMGGNEGNVIEPQKSATRAEIATIMTNFCEKFAA